MSQLHEDLAFIEGNDIRVTVVTNASPVCLVRLSHEASGTVVECTGKGQIGVRHEAVEEMRRRLRPPSPDQDRHQQADGDDLDGRGDVPVQVAHRFRLPSSLVPHAASPETTTPQA